MAQIMFIHLGFAIRSSFLPEFAKKNPSDFEEGTEKVSLIKVILKN